MAKKNKEPAKTDFKDEETGKELFRYAFAYCEKLEQQVRLIRDVNQLFHSDLVSLRSKIQAKCERILYLSCSKRRKAEELLWKNVMYSVISNCKKHKSVLDTTHPSHLLYSNHLMNASVYYQQLLHNLQDHYGIQITKMNAQQLEELEATNQSLDTLWLREACQRCLIYLGDVARYQVDLGFSPEHSMSYYHQAVLLDPSNGCPYNQLAALSELLQQPLEAIFYYLRSMTAQKPFHGVEKNLERLFKKNESHLSQLESDLQSTSEPQLTQFNKELLLARFLQLQNLFLKNSLSKQQVKSSLASSNSEEIGRLCSGTVSMFEECFSKDEHQFTLHCLNVAQDIIESGGNAMGENEDYLLGDPLLLKMSALAVLPAYNLRLKGSSDTLLACAFVFSFLSLLLQYSYKKLIHQTLAVAIENGTLPDNGQKPTVDQIIESGVTMVELIEGKGKVLTGSVYSSKTSSGTESKGSGGASPKKIVSGKISKLKEIKTKKKLKQIEKRRRKRKPRASSSDEEESDSPQDLSSRSSLSSLDDDIGEDDLDMIESLSESSSNASDDETTPKLPKVPLAKGGPSVQEVPLAKGGPSVQEVPLAKGQSLVQPITKGLPQEGDSKDFGTPIKSKSRRKFILAATFSMMEEDKPKHDEESLTKTPHPDTLALEIAKLHVDAKEHHFICLIISNECYLKPIKVISDWLQSYPAVLATYGKSSTTTIWSRLASLLNFLPSEEVLHKSGLVETESCASWAQTCSISEDRSLRGFAPLLRVHQALDYSENETRNGFKEALVRTQCLIKFGHYIASLKTVPSFEYDNVKCFFVGPAQKEKEQKRREALQQQKTAEEAKFNRSKLMKTMAQQRLQSEVAALAKATAQSQKSLFTPYLLPDAHTFCHNLHIVKKLIKTGKFVVIVAKSVIESLDLMKKEKDNFAAREAIKFLEKALQERNQFLKAQRTSETVHPGRNRPHKQEISQWLFDNLIDCAIYFNSTSSKPLLTLLLDKSLVSAFEEGSGSVDPYNIELLTKARQHGVEIDTVMRFHRRFQRSSS